MVVDEVKELIHLLLSMGPLILEDFVDVQELLIHFFFIFFKVVEHDVGNVFVSLLQEQVAVEHSWVKLAFFVLARSVVVVEISFSIVLPLMATD